MANEYEIETINEQDKDKIESLIDETKILLITANKNENLAVLSFLKPRSTEKKLFYHDYEFYIGFLKRTASYALGKFGRYNAAVHLMVNQGPAAAQSAIITAASCFKTLSAIFAVGVACGVKPKTQLLDVIVAKIITPYTAARISGRDEIKIESRSNPLEISHHFYEYFTKQPEWPINMNSPVTKYLKDKPKMHCGKVLSGNYLIDNKQIKELLLENFASDAIGIEMESAGLLHDYKCGNHHVPIMLVKAVCDLEMAIKAKSISLLQHY